MTRIWGGLRSKKGLTLVEILLALIIFVVLAGGIFYVFATARGWAAKNQRRLWGNTLSQDTIEFLKNAVTANPAPGAAGNEKYHDRDPATAVGSAANYALAAGAHADPLPAGHSLLAFAGSRSYTVEVLDPDMIVPGFPKSLSGGAAPDYQMRRARVTVTWTEPGP